LRAANKHLTATDVPMLVAFCQAVSKTHRLGRSGKVADWERASRIMMALATKLKLSPQSEPPRRSHRRHWHQLEATGGIERGGGQALGGQR
jgi:hypothetical protein